MHIWLTLLAPAALATGLPPMDTVTVVNASCQAVDEVRGPLYVTYDRVTGTCAPPGPDGVDPCTRWVEASLPGDQLSLWREGCEEPLQGHFVRDGSCGDSPRWRWEGRVDPGVRHTLGVDGQGALGWFDMSGAPLDRSCPAVSPRRRAVVTPTEVSHTGQPSWITFPAEDYSVVPLEAGQAALRWAPGPSLQHWVYQNADAHFDSAPMPQAEAQAWLDGALREPGGLAVRHQIVEYREHYEGYTLRGVPYCERVLEMDMEQRLRVPEDTERLGPPMRGTVRLRDSALAERCYPDE